VVLCKGLDYDAPVLKVWILYSEENHDVVELYDEEIKAYARNIKARRVVFTSPRAGWERRLSKYGYRPVKQIFEVEV
jgi:hypothetical protein